MLSPPVRRRCCVQRSHRHCTAPHRRLRTGKPLGSCDFPARHAHTRSIVARYALPVRIRSRPMALCFNRATSSPHPCRLISRLRPRFCATWVPGHSMVPRAERVIARTFKSSTQMVSKRRATSVLVFSTQSRRRSASRARTFAMASIVRARRADPRCARARRCCNLRTRLVSPARRAGARSNSPLDSATETATPRSTPTTLPSPGPGIGSGITAKAICQRPDRSQVTR